MSKHLYEEIDELHLVIERLNAAKESLEAQFDQMVMECFEVVSTTDVDQNGNHIERSVPKHYILAADVARLEVENERLRKALKGCKTHIAGFHLRDLDQAPAVLSEFNSELQRIHRLACAALEAKP